MSDLFGGTLNFNPAFEGRRMAIQEGANLASSFTSGMNSGTARSNSMLQQEQFNFQKKQYDDMIKRLEAMSGFLNDGMP